VLQCVEQQTDFSEVSSACCAMHCIKSLFLRNSGYPQRFDRVVLSSKETFQNVQTFQNMLTFQMSGHSATHCHVNDMTHSYVAVCCSVLQCVAVVAVCCSVLQCVAVCSSVLQCIEGPERRQHKLHPHTHTHTLSLCDPSSVTRGCESQCC